MRVDLNKIYLNFVIITARHEQGLLVMETDATHGPIMLIKLINECTHAVIP